MLLYFATIVAVSFFASFVFVEGDLGKHVLPIVSSLHSKKSAPIVPVKDVPPLYEYQAPNVVCPRDYLLQGQSCARQQSVSPDMSCQRGYTMQNGSCYKPVFDQTQKVCPKGMTMNRSGECYEIESTEPDIYCPDGYTRSGSTCIQTVAADAVPKCDRGFRLKGNYCLKEETPLMADVPPQCEVGAVLKPDGTCAFRRKDTTEPAPICPYGYDFQKGYCVKFQRPDYECEEPGFTLNPNNNLCEKDYEEPARDVSPDAEPTCNPGSEFNPQSQKCEQELQPDMTCPNGFAQASGGGCTKRNVADLAKDCPRGYSFSSNEQECTKTISAAPDSLCAPPAQLINNQCVSYQQDNAVPVCPSGFILNETGRDCTRVETTSPVLQCNMGYQLNNNQCVRPVAQKAAPPPPPPPQKKHNYFHH
eukprot:Platyproteum_vivax@DN4058_c0_g1_i1.p1